MKIKRSRRDAEALRVVEDWNCQHPVGCWMKLKNGVLRRSASEAFLFAGEIPAILLNESGFANVESRRCFLYDIEEVES